jgi:hypothetical protein
MSESLYVNRNVLAFASTHPHQDGWKVYELSAEPARKRFLHYLLDFLRDRYPDAVERRISVKEVLEEELMEKPAFLHPAEPGSEWDLSQELDSGGWFGLVHFKWAGHSIHVVSLLLKTGNGYSNVYHVATPSNVALRTLLKEIERYGQSRNKDTARQIYVVNGDDIPIMPVSWEDVFLPQSFLESIRNNVTGFFQSADRYRALGLPHRRGLLFAGAPGCGKTLTLKALAHNIPAKAITVLGSAHVEDEHINYAFQLAAKQAPAIVILEDLEKLVQSKDVSLSLFLNMLDGLRSLNGVMVIATANEPERLDPALLHRPSRFDRVWTFPLPALDQRLALLRRRGEAYFSESALEDAARKSQGFSMAYVQEIVVNALLESAHSGTSPSDADLARSLDILRLQRKCASKQVESLEEQESVGFCVAH